MNIFKTTWHKLFPPQHQPQVGEYYRSTIFPDLTCQIVRRQKKLVVHELMRAGKKPFKLLSPKLNVESLKTFNQLWEPYDQ